MLFIKPERDPPCRSGGSNQGGFVVGEARSFNDQRTRVPFGGNDHDSHFLMIRPEAFFRDTPPVYLRSHGLFKSITLAISRLAFSFSSPVNRSIYSSRKSKDERVHNSNKRIWIVDNGRQ